jgi:hypothetical protein
MWCIKCNNELNKCVCADLKERLARILVSPYLTISDDYKRRLEARAAQNAEEKTKAE